MSAPLPVTFFFPYPDQLANLDRHDLTVPGVSTHHFYSEEGKTRRRSWIVQTYLWLRHLGCEVSISDVLPRDGVVVLIPESFSRSEFLRQYGPEHQSLFVVTVRADVHGFRSSLGDADVVQNGRFADERRTFFVPHWPQPDLRPRDPSRGTTIQNIVFKGGYGSLHADFRSEAWTAYLRRRGLTFQLSSAHTEGAVPDWHDYRTADLNLAVRPPFSDGGMRCEKPASKLVNAWHAGVPSLLGKEYAFRELRRSDLDYVEVETVADATAAIDRLLANPARYREMIENGRKRAQAFTPQRIAERWAEVLFERIPAIASTRTFRASRPLPLQVRRAVNVAIMPPSPFELRKKVGHAVRQLSSASEETSLRQAFRLG